ncbi:MAG TPA: HD-GYP domain-containing protein [Nitriliruptorales bacterium]|nr:HD-GYP domain-containing protein [Nitriliruptorales bacterium]
MSEVRLSVVVVAILLAGLVATLWAARSVDGLVLVVAFIAAAALSDMLPSKVRDDVVVSLVSVVILAALLVGGPPLGILAVLGVPMVGWTYYTDRRLQRTAFNFGQMALSAAAAGLVFTLLGGVPGEVELWPTSLALLAGAIVWALVNNLLVGVALRLQSGERLRSSLTSLLVPSITMQSLYAGLSLLAAALLTSAGAAALLFLVVPALIARHGLLSFQAESAAYDRLVSALLKTLEVKDGYTRGHTERVSTLCVEVARQLGASYDELRAVRYAAKLHDVGKLGVPIGVINKPTALDANEFAMIREHPVIGADILGEIEFLRPALDGVRYHHERVDGEGYPEGRSGDDLPLLARIITVCDAFDAMTTTRSYRRAMELDRAFAELRRHSGTQFDGRVVDTLEQVAARLGWQPTPAPHPSALPAGAPVTDGHAPRRPAMAPVAGVVRG